MNQRDRRMCVCYERQAYVCMLSRTGVCVSVVKDRRTCQGVQCMICHLLLLLMRDCSLFLLVVLPLELLGDFSGAMHCRCVPVG